MKLIYSKNRDFEIGGGVKMSVESTLQPFENFVKGVFCVIL